MFTNIIANKRDSWKKKERKYPIHNNIDNTKENKASYLLYSNFFFLQDGGLISYLFFTYSHTHTGKKNAILRGNEKRLKTPRGTSVNNPACPVDAQVAFHNNSLVFFRIVVPC